MLYGLIGADAVMVIIFLLRFGTLPPQIPLFYSRAAGEDQLVDWWVILLLPILLNFLFFFNNFLYKKLFSGNDFVKKLLNFLNIFLIISIFLIFIKIIFLVT